MKLTNNDYLMQVEKQAKFDLEIVSQVTDIITKLDRNISYNENSIEEYNREIAENSEELPNWKVESLHISIESCNTEIAVSNYLKDVILKAIAVERGDTI